VNGLNIEDFTLSLQIYTKWDEWSDSDYEGVMQSDIDNGSLVPVSTTDFFRMIGPNEYAPKRSEIDYCMLNTQYDTLFVYDKDGIHWFYQ